MPARSRPLAALAAAALVLTLGGCAGRPDPPPAGVVDNQKHPAAPSATLPLRGTSRREAGSGAPAGRFDAPAGRFDAPGVPPRAPGFEVGDLPGRPAPSGSGSPPVRLDIPAIGVATPLVRLGLEADGGMQVPADFGRAGWFTGGPAPGQVGPSVIAGHVDSRTGPAVFYRLRELRPGQAILIERADGSRLRFVVEQARSYPKDGFPTAAVFGPVPEAALRLITCAGDFDRARGSYRDNLVVFARLAGEVGTDAGDRG
jgi:Sortase domain